MKYIGEMIREKRELLGLTQEELAQKCGYKSRSSINKIEMGREVPSKKVAMVAKALGISVYELLKDDSMDDGSAPSPSSSSTVEKIEYDMKNLDERALKRIQVYAEYLMARLKDEN